MKPDFSSCRAACACLFITLAVAACHDAPDDPTAVLLAEETRAALLVDEDLPTFPELIGEAGVQEELSGAMDLWLGAWDADSSEGAAARERAYAEASDRLARALGHGAVVTAHGQLGEALTATARLGDDGVPGDLQDGVTEATALHARAAGHLEERQDAAALTAVLRATDALRSVGPRGVAQMLIGRAAERMDVVRDAGGASATDLQRADRLLRGARVALDEENWSLAIRRGFYACQVLGISPR